MDREGNSTNISGIDDDGFTSDCRVYTIIVDGVLLSLLVLLCLVGNSVSLVTWRVISTVRGLSSTVIMLQTLAVSHSLLVLPLLFVTIIPFNLHLAYPDNSYGRYVEPYMVKYLWPCSTTANAVTVWVTTLITIHRYRVLCHPFSKFTITLTNVRSTCCQLIVIVICAIAYNIPRFLEFDFVTETNSSTVRLTLSAMHRNRDYQIWYRNVSYLSVMSVIPLLVTSILTVRIVQTLRKASRERRRMTSRRDQSSAAATVQRERSITLLLVTLIIFFIVCQSPTALVRIVIALSPGSLVHCGTLLFYLQEICLVLVTINSSSNVIVYSVCSADFRTTTRRILCHYKCCADSKLRSKKAIYSGINERTSFQVGGTSLSLMESTPNGRSRLSIMDSAHKQRSRLSLMDLQAPARNSRSQHSLIDVPHSKSRTSFTDNAFPNGRSLDSESACMDNRFFEHTTNI